MSECKHELAEQDTYIADGYCPLCLLDQIQRLQARVTELEANNKAAFIDGQLNAEINLAGCIAKLVDEVKALRLEVNDD